MNQTSPALATPRFETLGPLLLAGFARNYAWATLREIPALWDRFGPRFGSIPGQVGMVAYGVIYNMGERGFDYMAAAVVADVANLPADMTSMTVPARKYAVFKHDLHISRLNETMELIWKQWLPASGIALAQGPGGAEYLERYDEEFDPAVGLGHVELWMPLKG